MAEFDNNIDTTSERETYWRCTICGYEYIGEDMPDDFICPRCSHGKDDYEKLIR